MPIPATPKKLPTNALVTPTPRKPINASDKVVNVVAKAPMARAVYTSSAIEVNTWTAVYALDFQAAT